MYLYTGLTNCIDHFVLKNILQWQVFIGLSQKAVQKSM